ncbi:MAG: hypothetical protein WA532_15660 [Candidatus Korobacteraceae bacterium]
MNVHFAYVVYMLTFPNGAGHSIRYFGSWSNQLVEADFTKEELSDLTIRKQILFESNDKVQVSMKEVEFIRALNSTDPCIGYNQWPRKQA